MNRYEIWFGAHLWRVEPVVFNGTRRVSAWPFYAAHDGSIRPGMPLVWQQ